MPPDSPLTILVVDDNPINIKLLETSLVKDGYNVLKASGGVEAKQIAIDSKPDLILLDIQMPGESGFDVIKFLKKNSSTHDIPVLFLTGLSELDSKLEGFRLGAVDYITKPFHPLEVSARVSLHLKLSIATNSLITSQANKLRQIEEVQSSMLTTPDQQPGARFGVYFSSLQEAGGDFYDVISISNDIYGYFVGDFSGHDIGTGYLTSSVKGLLKQNSSMIYTAEETVRMMNDVLLEILPGGKYLTAIYARLNRKKRQMTIINAGHPPAVYVPKNGEPEFLKMEGDVIGIFKNVLFGNMTRKIGEGDRFYLYSDGLVESPDNKVLWTAEHQGLLEACNLARNVSIEDAPEKIVRKLHADVEVLEDDIVIVGIEV